MSLVLVFSSAIQGQNVMAKCMYQYVMDFDKAHSIAVLCHVQVCRLVTQ